MRRLASFLPILAGTLMIMAVVVINGRPSVFTDTDDYYIEGRTAIIAIAQGLGIKKPDPPPTDPQDIADAAQLQADIHMSHTEIGARSPFYGAFLYVTQKIGTIWFTSIVQALIGAWLTWLIWRMAAPRAPPWTAYMVEAAVAFGTTLPFFASFSMPDIFSGYAVVSAVLLLVYWEPLGLARRVALAVLLTFAMATHTSHLLVVEAIAVLALIGYFLLRAPRQRASAAMFAVIGAVLATVAFGMARKDIVMAETGDELHRPPFLAFRVIADGPGREYLKDACPKGAVWTLCQFRNLPNTDSQDMLWSDDHSKGIFNVTSFDNRLKMEQQETSFVLHAVAYDPVGQVIASLKNWGGQLIMVYVDDPLRNPHYYLTNAYWSTTNLPWLINHAADCGRDHWGCQPRLTMDGSFWLHAVLIAASLGLVLWWVTRREIIHDLVRRKMTWKDEQSRLFLTVMLLLAAVLINAFVCGALSGPFARYQARITWLVTLAGALGVAAVVPARFTVPGWVGRVRALPLVEAFEKRFDFAFLRFGMVGTAGFLVHATVLNFTVHVLDVNPYLGWVAGFTVGVTTTLLLNRAFTFKRPSRHGPWRQAILYICVQSVGAAANFATYAAAIALIPPLSRELWIPLAMGSCAGLCLTFLGSKHVAFRPAKTEPAGEPA